MARRDHGSSIVTGLFLKYWTVLALAAAAVILVLGYTFLVHKKILEVREVGVSGLRSQQRELTEIQAYLQQLRQMVDAFSSKVSVADQRLVERAVPTGQQVPNLLSVVNDLASQVGFSVESFSVSDVGATSAVPNAGATGKADQLGSALQTVRGETATDVTGSALLASARQLKLRVSLKGPSGYEAMRQLLDAVELSSRIFDIEQFNFVLGGPGGAPGEASSAGSFEMTVTTPYLPTAGES
ncbi:MAG: hypothetical protein HYZ09_02855 [Candidatus Kerfeldbacteria bacterium]|nr:hypothetical protein [Candidatus Kerfeldbacteria bacterium]